MNGLIAAAGISTRLQDLTDRSNKVLLDLGGESLLTNLLSHFERAGVTDTVVAVGFDALAVRTACGTRARCVLNPFFEHYGILGSIWLSRPFLDGQAFVFTTGDHYFTAEHLHTFLADQPDAEVLVDVELKTCDDEDMKVFLNRTGKLRTISKTMLAGPVLGEMTGLVRFSDEGSRVFFLALEKHVWQRGIQGYLADLLCILHRQRELAFHLSDDHQRIEVDFPCDLTRARQLFAQHRPPAQRTG